MQDRRGRPIARPVQWSSSDSSIATVSDSGVVTGVAAGNASIVATYRDVTGSAQATVTPDSTPPPPPPPPPPSTLLFEEDFENANLASRGWYDNTNVVLSTTQHMTGSTASAQYHFLQGATSPTSGDAQRHKFTPSSSLYISYDVKYSANW